MAVLLLSIIANNPNTTGSVDKNGPVIHELIPTSVYNFFDYVDNICFDHEMIIDS